MPKCRFCNGLLEKIFLDLGETPLANSYLSNEEIHNNEEKFPLKALVCNDCYLVQLEEFETPQKIFSNYAYFSSYSKSFLNHAKNYVDMMIDRFQINKNKFVQKFKERVEKNVEQDQEQAGKIEQVSRKHGSLHARSAQSLKNNENRTQTARKLKPKITGRAINENF